jgi:hypothetical protein
MYSGTPGGRGRRKFYGMKVKAEPRGGQGNYQLGSQTLVAREVMKQNIGK